MRSIQPRSNPTIAFHLALLTAACLLPCGCKHSAPVPPATATSGTTASSTPAGSDDKPGSLTDRLKSVQDAAAHQSTSGYIPLPDWKEASTSAPGIEIPLIKGLLVDSTIASATGDIEDFHEIMDINPTTITVRGDNEVPPKTQGGQPPPPDPKTPHPGTGTGTILVDVADLASSNHLAPFFATNQTIHIPGSLDRGVSTETLRQLQTGKQVDWQFVTSLPMLMAGALSMRPQPTTVDWKGYRAYACNLQRVEAKDIAVPVLVNNEPVELPAIHVKCTMDAGGENHFYILDQLSNPIFLYTSLGSVGDTSQTTKITFSTKKPSDMEKKLADKEPVDIYGIYFDFNSAVLKPQSEVVLKQIADVMTKNPTWKLSVAGHTDNVGGNDFNLKLSQARAEAVKTALVTEFKIAPDRLATSGYGASQPIADNSKVEGRARNRRVVLQRQ